MRLQISFRAYLRSIHSLRETKCSEMVFWCIKLKKLVFCPAVLAGCQSSYWLPNLKLLFSRQGDNRTSDESALWLLGKDEECEQVKTKIERAIISCRNMWT